MTPSKNIVFFCLSMAIFLMISSPDVEGARTLAATNTSKQVKKTTTEKDPVSKNYEDSDSDGYPGHDLYEYPTAPSHIHP